MTFSLDEVLGPEMFRPEKKEAVLYILEQLPESPQARRRLYSRWARQVNVEVLDEDLARLSKF